MSQHQAAFLNGARKALCVGPAATKTPGPGEVLIRIKAIAINPADWKIQESGYFVKSWPAILGEDAAGEVLEVGANVKTIAKGQRVMVHSWALATQKWEQGTFQELMLSPQASVAPLPDSISFEQGSVLPLSVSTAAAGLFQSNHLGLDYPKMNASKNGKKLLIWGGSSSVGGSAVQLAAAAGYIVIATASRHNFDYVKKLGATEVFDYHDSDVETKIVTVLRKSDVAGVYDAIGLKDSETQAAHILAQLGGGKIATVLPPPADLPSSVTSKSVYALSIFQDFKEVGKAVWQEFLPNALKSGNFKAAPDAKLAGKTLESLQAALEAQKAGVSAKKIVVSL